MIDTTIDDATVLAVLGALRGTTLLARPTMRRITTEVQYRLVYAWAEILFWYRHENVIIGEIDEWRILLASRQGWMFHLPANRRLNLPRTIVASLTLMAAAYFRHEENHAN